MFLVRSFYDAKQTHASGEKYHIVSGPGNYNTNLCSLFYTFTFYNMFLGRSLYDAKQKQASGPGN